MKLAVWVAKEMIKDKKNPQSKTAVLKKLSADSGVSLLTLQGVERGGKLVLFPKAKAISEATGGKVTPLELVQ